MIKTVLVILYVCGQPDTFIVKEPELAPTYTHAIVSEDAALRILKILETNPIVIRHEDNRGTCA